MTVDGGDVEFRPGQAATDLHHEHQPHILNKNKNKAETYSTPPNLNPQLDLRRGLPSAPAVRGSQ